VGDRPVTLTDLIVGAVVVACLIAAAYVLASVVA
jgi:hypothetical protein